MIMHKWDPNKGHRNNWIYKKAIIKIILNKNRLNFYQKNKIKNLLFKDNLPDNQQSLKNNLIKMKLNIFFKWLPMLIQIKQIN